MDALRLLPGEPPATGEHVQPQPRDAAARWRQELERAQWALRTREAASSASSASAGRGDATSPAAALRASAPTANRAEAAAASSGRPASQPGAGPAAAPAQPFAQARSAAPAPNPPGAALPPATPRQESAAAALPAPEEPGPQPERFTWPRTHVHVVTRDGATHIWVRDGTLDEAERRRLALQLAARLRSSGVRLGSLTVNGEEILTLEGVTSWQSKQ